MLIARQLSEGSHTQMIEQERWGIWFMKAPFGLTTTRSRAPACRPQHLWRQSGLIDSVVKFRECQDCGSQSQKTTATYLATLGWKQAAVVHV